MYNTFETYFVFNAKKRICFVTATMELFLIDHFSEEKLLNCTFFLILEPCVCFWKNICKWEGNSAIITYFKLLMFIIIENNIDWWLQWYYQSFRNSKIRYYFSKLVYKSRHDILVRYVSIPEILTPKSEFGVFVKQQNYNSLNMKNNYCLM